MFHRIHCVVRGTNGASRFGINLLVSLGVGASAVFALTIGIASAQESAAESGILQGRIVYVGESPLRRQLSVPAGTNEALYDESLVVNKDGGVRNVLVYALDENIPYRAQETPRAPATITHRDRRFEPHVTVIMTGQKLILRNQEPNAVVPLLSSSANPPMNISLRPGAEHELFFAKPERLPLKLSSSIHPWYHGWLLVRDNPYFAISSQDGSFKINDLPTGKWTFQFWHEKVGYLKSQNDWLDGRTEISIGKGLHDLGTIELTEVDLELP